MTDTAVLEATSLVATYGRRKVLEGFDLSVKAGQASAVLGHNGAGKTTALRCLAGLKGISGGQVRLCGQDVSTLAAPSRAQLGLALVVDAGSGVFPDLTVDQNLAVANSHLKSRRDRDVVLEELVALHEAFKVLAERRRALASSLSGGQRQLLAIAVALSRKPRVLLLDEPSTGLAPVIVEQIFGVLDRYMGQGLAVVMVEQDVKVALALADRIHILKSGSIVSSFAASECPPATELWSLF